MTFPNDPDMAPGIPGSLPSRVFPGPPASPAFPEPRATPVPPASPASPAPELTASQATAAQALAAAMADLEMLKTVALSDQAEVFERIHENLTAALAATLVDGQ